jgi:hypothetical protein
MSYKCINCNYKTKLFSDMKKHLNLKRSCIKELSSNFEYTVDQTIVLSLLSFNDNNEQNIDKDKIKDIKYIYKNKKILLNILTQIDKNKEKTCSYCSKIFNKVQDLREHILLECFTKEMQKVSEQTYNNCNNDNSTNNNSTNDNCYNTNTNNTNNTNSNNTNNTTNIIINLPPIAPIAFDKSWSFSEILEFKTKYDILQSDIMYTTLLQKLLENKVNMNVIVDISKNIGFVYKNDDEKYVRMDINKIAESSMEKLHLNLLELNNNINEDKTFFKDTIKFNEDRINNKLNEYKKNPDTKQKVDYFIADAYDKRKDNAYNISKNVENNSLDILENGY